MPKVIFAHENVSPNLTITTGVDDVSWGYGLNTQTFPTYGGEVVQILSIFTDDVEVGGTVQTYAEMENIYEWFLRFMQNATQGGPDASYNQTPVKMHYPERHWTWHIVPKSLPAFRYGREVVAPEWRMQAAVIEESEEVKQITLQAAKDGLSRITAGIGYRADNPFSDPFAGVRDFKITDLNKYYDKIADSFSKLIPKYMEGDYDSLLGEIGSKPAFMERKAPKTGQQNRNSDR